MVPWSRHLAPDTDCRDDPRGRTAKAGTTAGPCRRFARKLGDLDACTVIPGDQYDGRTVGLTVSDHREQKKQERAVRRAQLQAGDEFRPYDLFDEIVILPAAMMATTLVSAGAKLCWAAIAKRIGKSGPAYPSLKTLGRDLGVDRRQVFRWVAELEREKLLLSIERPAAPGDNDSNEYRLLWHPLFLQGDASNAGVDKSSTPTGVDKLSIPGSDRSSIRGVDKSSSKKRHHHQEKGEKRESELGSGDSQRKPVQSVERKTGRRKPKPFRSVSDDDDGKPKREPLEDPEDELRLRFRERFVDESGALVQLVMDGLSYDRQALKEFVIFDDAHTGAPASLVNPGGYYRNLVKEFRAARSSRIEAERRERYRTIERTLVSPEPEEQPVCELGLCEGVGELFENGKYRPCDCAAGQRLSPKVREMMETLNRGAA
ncbi:MAG TPA: helix-turn-helix domain-containing protein [Bryobacteraceae bacterium]